MRHKHIALAFCTVHLILPACSNSDQPADAAASTPGMASDAGSLASIAPKGRLPAGVRPVSYRVDLELDPRQNDFSGEVSIDVSLDAPTNRIWLHGKDLDVSDASASTGAGNEMPGDYQEVLPTGVSAISFDRDLPVLVLCDIWVPTGFAQTEIAQKKNIFPIRNNG